MFSFFTKSRRKVPKLSVLEHNQIDHTIMSRLLGMPVLKTDFNLKEDRTKILAPGVTWRRRRFLFQVPAEDTPEKERPEGLCINEIIVDSDAHGDIRPVLASEYNHLVDLAEIENAYWQTTFAKGAIRSETISKETRLYLNLSALFYGTASRQHRELIHHLFTLERERAADERLLGLLDPLAPTMISQADDKFDVVRYLPAFPVSRLVQSSENILAATNAGYFLNFPEEYNDQISALHQPLGGHVIEGRLVAPPWIARPGIARLKDGRQVCRIFGPQDMELQFDGLAPVALVNGLLENGANGKTWRFFDAEEFNPPIDAIQVLFTGPLLVSLGPAAPDAKPPLGGGMIWLTGDHAREAMLPNAAARLSLRMKPIDGVEIDWMVSAGPFLVMKGEPVSPAQMLLEEFAGEFRPLGPAPTRFPFDADRTRAPRTAIGTTATGGYKFVVVDGRRSGEHSCGITLDGFAKLMQWVGCDTALNLDGGGSSVMAVEGATRADALRENSPHGVVNIPSDGAGIERIVPIFLTVQGR